MNSVLHLLNVFFWTILYFSPLSEGTLLSFKYHSPEQKYDTGSSSIQHDRLTLDDLAARTSSESIVGPFGKGPTSKKIARESTVIRLKAASQQDF